MRTGSRKADAGDFQVSHLSGSQDFAPWQKAWKEFLRDIHCLNPFLHADWLLGAWAYPGKSMSLTVITKHGRIWAGFALCPRWESRAMVHLPVRALHSLAHLPNIQPNHAVMAARAGIPSDIVRTALISALRLAPWSALCVSHLGENTEWFEPALRTLASERGWGIRQAHWSPEAVVGFRDGPDAYWATRSGQMKRKLNTNERVLEQLGHLEFSDLATTGATWTQAWNTMLGLYHQSWQHGAGLSPFEAGFEEINQRVLQPFYERARLHVYVLSLDGHPIAFDLWLGGGDIQYGITRGMHPRYRDHSSGGILARRGIALAFSQGYREQWLGPYSDHAHFAYKQRWLTHTVHGPYLIVSRPWSMYGMVERALGSHKLHAFWKRHQIGERSKQTFQKLAGLRHRFR